MHRRARSNVVALVGALVALAVLAPAARADFGVTVSGGPTSVAAGAHSDLRLQVGFPDTGADRQDVRALLLELPPGLVGNPNAASRCSASDFAADACTSAAQVGEVSADADVAVGGFPLGSLTIAGEIYDLAPQGGEPARLGIHLHPTLGPFPLPPIDLQAPVELRAPGDYGLDTLITDIPNQLSGVQTHLTAMRMTLYATPPGSSTPFLTNPTRCVPEAVKVSAISYGHESDVKTASTSFTPTGCDQVPFAPTLGVTPDRQTAGQPGAVAVTVGLPAGDTAGRAQSQPQTVRVTLPVGTALSPGVAADGLDACTDAGFAADATAAPDCPAASQIGTVRFETPLLGALDGTVYLGAPTADAPLRLLAYAALGDVRVKLTGTVAADPTTGQLTTTFTDLPQVPFTAFTLAFRGGPTAVLTAPDGCGDHQASARLEPYSAPGTAAQPVAAFATVDCATPGFAPTVASSLSTTQAGADTHATTTITRTDADRRLDRLAISLPPGLLGHLDAIPACPVADARQGACSPDSQVGVGTVAAGTGSRPLGLQGPIYLTGPVDDGVAGLAVVLPAKVGPLDLGKVVTVAKLTVRPSDAGIDVTTDALPRILGGIPLAIRSLKLDLNRDGFLFNASSCDALAVRATFTADDGTVATADAPYQATGCGSLPFAPTVSAAISGPAAHPALRTTVSQPAGQARLSAVKLTLPPQLSADLSALSRACPEATLEAGGCPASSVVGSASAATPIVPAPLQGPVTLVSVPGHPLPDLVVDLSGPLDLRLRIATGLAGQRIVSTVGGIPDVPLSSFTLNLAAGGLLASSPAKLCTGTATVDGGFTAHSGATASASTAATRPCSTTAASRSPLKVGGTLTGTRRGGTPSLTVKVKGTRLRSLRIGLPSALRLSGRRLRAGGRAVAGGKRLSTRRTLPHTRTTVTARAPKAVSTLQLTLARGALGRGAGLQAGRKVTIGLRVVDAAGKVRYVALRLTARR